MSIAKAAARAMLSDALLQDSPGIQRLHHLELELPLDKVIKFVSVGLPLLLVCVAFAREVSLGEHFSLSLIKPNYKAAILNSKHVIFMSYVHFLTVFAGC